MYQPMIIWAITVGIVIIALAYKTFHKSHKPVGHSGHILEIGNEKDLFYCPGDKKRDEQDDLENL